MLPTIAANLPNLCGTSVENGGIQNSWGVAKMPPLENHHKAGWTRSLIVALYPAAGYRMGTYVEGRCVAVHVSLARKTWMRWQARSTVCCVHVVER